MISKGKSSSLVKKVGKIAWESAKGGSKSGIQSALLSIKKEKVSASKIMKDTVTGAIGGAFGAGSDGIVNGIANAMGKTVNSGVKIASRMASGASYNIIVSAKNGEKKSLIAKTAGIGGAQGLMSVGFDTLKEEAGVSGFEVGSMIIGGLDYLNDFAFGIMDSGTS